jgi:RimJ/RimL family protein N-acetyltransferase
LVKQDSEAARRYIERELGLHVADPFIGLVIERDHRLVGAIVLNDYTPGQNIEMTGHSSANWSPKDVREIARYCFGRVRRITARTSVKNAKAIKMLEAIGFKREGILRGWFDDADAIVFGLLRSEQRIYR